MIKTIRFRGRAIKVLVEKYPGPSGELVWYASVDSKAAYAFWWRSTFLGLMADLSKMPLKCEMQLAEDLKRIKGNRRWLERVR